MPTTINETLDLKGLSCPMPIVKTAKRVRELNFGDVIEVLATDPGAVPDFRAWCRSTHNELLEESEEGGTYRFVIRKSPPKAKG
ncbi:MAG: sulfurtransferase TusA family protein [Actinomycetota bacterium]